MRAVNLDRVHVSPEDQVRHLAAINKEQRGKIAYLEMQLRGLVKELMRVKQQLKL